jgi:carboxyl-terminal processing protease
VMMTQNPETDAITSTLKTVDQHVYFSKPLVVLIDAYSASASEIFAGGIQDHKLGYVVGTRSFGKGTVQQLSEDQILGGIMRSQTIGRFHLPSGRTNQIVGILPDFEAYRSPNPTEEDKFALYEGDRYRDVIRTGTTERFLTSAW